MKTSKNLAKYDEAKRTSSTCILAGTNRHTLSVLYPAISSWYSFHAEQHTSALRFKVAVRVHPTC